MKYMGSKQRLSKDLVPIIQSYINKDTVGYLEPFVGGANVIDKINCDIRIGCDINEYLIEMLKAIQRGWMPPADITKEEYNDIKNNKENYPKELVAIAGFCATYNAKWFGGYAGKVKTKIGTIRNYYDEAVRNLLKQKDSIVDINFVHKDFLELDEDDISGYVVYCDPPYEGTTKYRDDFPHERYWEWVRYMSKHNIVLCSEYNAPNDFECIYTKELTTTLDKNSRKKDVEKLFIHKSLKNTYL